MNKNNRDWIVDLDREEQIRIRKQKRKIVEDNPHPKHSPKLIED